MNGYDAIMQGRHGLRNMTQPSNTEYYRYIRLEETISEEERERGSERKREIGHEYRPRVSRFVDRCARIFVAVHIAPRVQNDFAMHAPSDEKHAILVKQLSRARKSDAEIEISCARSVRTNELRVVRSTLKRPRRDC